LLLTPEKKKNKYKEEFIVYFAAPAVHLINAYEKYSIPDRTYLFSCTLPAPKGRQMGEMLMLKGTSVARVMMA
jgi:hypothetical protein